MIPDHVNDGFTRDLGDGVLVRPMLWEAKKDFHIRAKECPEDALSWLMGSVYCVSSVPDDPEIEAEVVKAILGYNVVTENMDFQKLSDTLTLQVTRPGLSQLECSDCRKYSVDMDTGEVQYRQGQPLPIPGGCRIPCETDFGCMKGHWSDPIGLAGTRWAATWAYYWKYQAAGRDYRLMNCPLAERNRLLFDWVLKYGRHRGFNPFAGRSAGRRISDGVPAGDAGSDRDRAGCTAGGSTGRAGAGSESCGSAGSDWGCGGPTGPDASVAESRSAC